MVNNNEKIQNLLRIKADISPLMSKYLTDLQTRYEWSKEARSQYFKIKRKINSVANSLLRVAKSEAKQSMDYDNLGNQVHEESVAILEEDTDDEISSLGKRGLEELTTVSRSEFTADYAETMHAYIKKHVSIPKRRLLYLLRKKASAKPVNQERITMAKKLASQLQQLSSNHMSKSYKEFSISEFIENLNIILKRLNTYGFNEQTSQLQTISQISEWDEPKYPNSEEIIEKLHEIRNPSMYIKRGYTVLEYVRPVYKNLSYFQRALREGREYIGTNNAYNRLLSALNELEGYYKAHYVQAGGKPKNYHGHYVCEKP